MHLALLRGINVGGKAILPMRDLIHVFAQSGAQNIQTYVQSGNVLFDSENAEACVAQVTSAIAKRFAYPGRIVLRSAEELHQAFLNNPFVQAGVPTPTLHIYFLAGTPTPAALRTLDPARSPGDTYAIRNRDIYLALPNGMARTKLTNAWFDAKLSTVSTARNWNTVTKLTQLAGLTQ